MQRRTLAADLRNAERDLRDIEARVEAYLTQISRTWQGWRFTAPDGIDVWMVQDSPGLAHLLHAQGFLSVTLHNHRAERFLSCTCSTREYGVDR